MGSSDILQNLVSLGTQAVRIQSIEACQACFREIFGYIMKDSFDCSAQRTCNARLHELH